MLAQLKNYKRSQTEEKMKLGGAYQNHDLMFATAEGGPLSIQNFTMRHFKPTLKRAGLPLTFTLYSLRHTPVAAQVHQTPVNKRVARVVPAPTLGRAVSLRCEC